MQIGFGSLGIPINLNLYDVFHGFIGICLIAHIPYKYKAATVQQLNQ